MNSDTLLQPCRPDLSSRSLMPTTMETVSYSLLTVAALTLTAALLQISPGHAADSPSNVTSEEAEFIKRESAASTFELQLAELGAKAHVARK